MSVIVKVNGKDITDRDLNRAYLRFIIQLEEDETLNFEPNEQNLKYIRIEALNYLIEQSLVEDIAIKAGITVSDKEIEDEIQFIKSKYENNQEEWNYNLAILDIDDNYLKKEIYKDLLINKYLNKIFKEEITFNDEDVENYYNTNKNLMKIQNTYTYFEISLDNLRDNISSISEHVSNENDIDSLKKIIESFDLQYEIFTNKNEYDIPSEIINVLNNLENGKIGLLNIDDNNSLLIKLLKKTEGRELSFSEIKEGLKEYLYENGKKEIYNNIVNSAYETAKIEYLDNDFFKN